jgi:RNA recognition motif-containing protein
LYGICKKEDVVSHLPHRQIDNALPFPPAWFTGELRRMKLYLGNLPFKVSESDVTTWFQQHGVTVDSVTIMRDRFSNEPRGFGFAEIHDDAEGQRAIQECHGQQMGGRALVINEARPMTKGPGGGGGDRGDRGERGPRGPRRDR